MKKIAIYGKQVPAEFRNSIDYILDWVKKNGVEAYVYHPFFEFLLKSGLNGRIKSTFTGYNDLPGKLDAMLCIGGDGTFLEAVSVVREKNIPLVGVHTGRLGFLANITVDELPQAMDLLARDEYELEKRTLLQLSSDTFTFPEFNSALNEFTVYKRDSSSMITIHTLINGRHLNTYWADGLIISTPTGSTAYSMSMGGPIITPDSRNFIITPIAPHTLTVRPIVVPDEAEITLHVESRSGNCMVSLDHRSFALDAGIELKLSKAGFTITTIRLHNQDFFTTLRQKLMWGADKRN
jgi:NAD+ kinase